MFTIKTVYRCNLRNCGFRGRRWCCRVPGQPSSASHNLCTTDRFTAPNTSSSLVRSSNVQFATWSKGHHSNLSRQESVLVHRNQRLGRTIADKPVGSAHWKLRSHHQYANCDTGTDAHSIVDKPRRLLTITPTSLLTSQGSSSRALSSASLGATDVKAEDKTEITDNMEFVVRNADKRKQESARTVVVLFGFYGAKPKAIDVYCSLYHKHGMDVVYIPSYLSHFAWPKNSLYLAERVLSFLTSNCASYEKILVHAMSMGAYNFTVVMGELYNKPDRYRSVQDKITAVVYDSLTIGSLQHMAVGVGRGASKNPVIQKLIPMAMSSYLFMFYRHTVPVFDQYIEMFKKKPLEIPTLVFYAKNDPMSDFHVLHGLVNEWKSRIEVTDKYWDKSKHAAHLHVHTQDYTQTLDSFIKRVPGLVTSVKSQL